MISTTAWVLHQDAGVAGLREEAFSFPDLLEDEALLEPIYGCWEANMTHAVERNPVNIALLRREKRIVLGNAGVVRVLRVGTAVNNVKEGDLCIFCAAAQLDDFGYTTVVHGYDGRGTVGLLAKQMKARSITLFPIPEGSKYSPQQWAGFSLRYLTAWSNWKVAIGAYRLQISETDDPRPSVWGWGGGTTLAELDLARRAGCDAAMISGSDHHLREIEALGITAIDRRQFADLNFDAENDKDPSLRLAYSRAERSFLKMVKERTQGRGAAIFVDYIGSPVYRASLRALGRQGVLTTAGWKHGMELPTNRANECIKRHIHVFTHAARAQEADKAIAFGEREGWMPNVATERGWDEIPALAEDFAAGRVNSYFPIFAVNPL